MIKRAPTNQKEKNPIKLGKGNIEIENWLLKHMKRCSTSFT